MSEAADWAVGARRRRVPVKVMIAGLVAVAAIVSLIVFGMGGSTVYSLTVSELIAKGQEVTGEGVRVSGMLDGKSVSFDPQAVVLKFNIVGDGATLSVIFKGVKPDNMRDDTEVIVEGKLLADGTFEASNLLFKCPSKYQSGTPTPAGS